VGSDDDARKAFGSSILVASVDFFTAKNAKNAKTIAKGIALIELATRGIYVG